MKKIALLLPVLSLIALPLFAENSPMMSEPSKKAPATAPATPAAPAPAPAASSEPAAPAASMETTAPAMTGVKVVGIEIARGVESREPVDPATSFDSSMDRVYCWTKISAESAPISIHHVWYADGEKTADVPLNINSASARTWSYKTVWPGSWKVEVTDDAGTVLSSKEFTISKMDSMSVPADTMSPAPAAVPASEPK